MLRLMCAVTEAHCVARQAIAVADHKPSLHETLDGTSAAGLWSVGGEGLHLVSNGWPHPANNEVSPVAYADGYRTNAGWRPVDHHVGDDACEVVPLGTAQADCHVLHTEIANSIACSATHLPIGMDVQTVANDIVAPAGPKENR